MITIRQKSLFLFLIIAVTTPVLLHCDSLLFPTSKPVSNRMDSPQAVINQLVKAYSHMNPDMLDTIFCAPSDSFRFYVPATLSGDFQNINKVNNNNKGDQVISPDPKITTGLYMSLTSSNEYSILKNIHEQSADLTFTVPLTPSSIDTVYDTILHDTVARVHTSPTSITITSLDFVSTTFDVGEQIFIMQRKPDGTWGIRYWFEMED